MCVPSSLLVSARAYPLPAPCLELEIYGGVCSGLRRLLAALAPRRTSHAAQAEKQPQQEASHEAHARWDEVRPARHERRPARLCACDHPFRQAENTMLYELAQANLVKRGDAHVVSWAAVVPLMQAAGYARSAAAMAAHFVREFQGTQSRAA